MFGKIILGLAVFFVVLVIHAEYQTRRRAAWLAAKRTGLHPSQFIDALIADGVSEDVAEYLWDAVAPNYGEGDIWPHPDDNLRADAGIAPDDIEEGVAHFFDMFGLPQPVRGQPEHIPADLTLRTLAHYLDQRRAALADDQT